MPGGVPPPGFFAQNLQPIVLKGGPKCVPKYAVRWSMRMPRFRREVLSSGFDFDPAADIS
jgi:hypothetical protein